MAISQQMPLPPTPALQPEQRLRTLQQDLHDIFGDPNFSNAHWGVTIQSMESGQYLFRLNDTKSFIPASNQKLFTSALALNALGPDFRYTTQLLTDGRISDHTLRGDLIIRGSGDPTLGSASLNSDNSILGTFEAWADSLERLGITRIIGNIVGDDTYFTPERYPMGWAVEDMPYYFAMQSSGLSFAENKVKISAWPDSKAGRALKFHLEPATEYVDVVNEGVTKRDSLMGQTYDREDSIIAMGTTTVTMTRPLGFNRISVTGEIPRSEDTIVEQLSVEDPTLYAAEVFREVLEERGIEIRGKTLSVTDLKKRPPYLKSRQLAQYTSPPLSEILKVVNKRSNNLYAEQLYRTVAKEREGEGSWEKGTVAMKKFAGSIGIDPQRMAVYDGSGLSRMDLVSPIHLVTLLRYMYQRKALFSAFFPSLGIMGVDGNIASRLRETKAQGNVRAKTGFVTGVRSISGYLTTHDGEMLAFSIIANNFTVPVSLANNLQDLVLLRLVNFSRY